MQKKSANPVALVTGAARRIGAEVARTLHQAGMNIVLHYSQSKQDAEGLAASLNAMRADSVVTVSADLSQVTAASSLAESALKAWGRMDLLVNNAACFYKTPLGKVSESDWDQLLSTNLKAPFFLAQALAPFLREQQGAIINIADIHGRQPLRDYTVYCISKAGLIMMTKALAKDLGPAIRVNAVAPGGGVIWPEGENTLSSEAKAAIVRKTALEKEGSPSDIAKAVLFFAKDAGHVTGQVLAVDGGRL